MNLWLSDTVDYYWQIAKIESWHWEVVIYNKIVTWTAFAILAMFCTVSGISQSNWLDHPAPQSTSCWQKMRRLQLFRAQTEFQETTSLSLILQGLVALRNYWPTNSWNSCILAQNLIQLIIFSSPLPQTRSFPAIFFLKFFFLLPMLLFFIPFQGQISWGSHSAVKQRRS